MFALGVELLMGRAIITRWGSREEPEWPPHPDRVFMALVAAWGEGGEDAELRNALTWLESLGPPQLRVSLDAASRASVTSYVPANDAQSPLLRGKDPTEGQVAQGIKLLPEKRGKNGRCFPTIVPGEPVFYLVWPEASLPEEHRLAVASLCRDVTYLGHSATPIRMWIEHQPVEPSLVPCEHDPQLWLRVFGEGRTDYLKNRFDAGLRPLPTSWQGYSVPVSPSTQQVVDGPFDAGLIVLRQVGGRKFSLESGAMIAETVRKALMSRHGKNPPEWLSGHAPDGSPSTRLRPAYLPLGFVGREHADGHLLGVAISIPAGFDNAATDLLYDLLGRHDGCNAHDIEAGTPYLALAVSTPGFNRFVGMLELVIDETSERNPTWNLRPSTWTGPSRRWATVTPVLLPRFPRRDLTPEAVIAKACVDAGYPRPVIVRTGHAPCIEGVPHSREFVVQRSNDRPVKPWLHAEIEFEQPVRGPLLLGAGRYIGLGVCRPLSEEVST